MRIFPVFSSVCAFALSGVFSHRSLLIGFGSLGKGVCLPQLRSPCLPVLPTRLPQPAPLPQLCPLPSLLWVRHWGCLEPSLRLRELPLRVLFSFPSPRIKELLEKKNKKQTKKGAPGCLHFRMTQIWTRGIPVFLCESPAFLLRISDDSEGLTLSHFSTYTHGTFCLETDSANPSS